MAGNAFARTAQAGGSPYDEEDYMRMPPRPLMNTKVGPQYEDAYIFPESYGMARYISRSDAVSPSNAFLNRRLTNRIYGEEMVTPGLRQPATDTEMMEIYGPEDEVAYDSIGRPIPLNDPRHPRNQTPGNALAPFGYPQRR
jgi:hypothetical protein